MSKNIEFVKCEASDFKFLARNWNIANDQSNASYDVGNEIIYNTESVEPNICDCDNAYILAFSWE